MPASPTKPKIPVELTNLNVKLMYTKGKDKEFGTMQRFQHAMNKGYLRYCVFFTVLLSISIFSFTFFNSETASVLISPDRSEAYNVKIMPSSLADKELNELPRETFSYLAMIDAGSSGCRAHVYRFGKLGSITGPLYVLPEHNSLKVKPGLSSFAEQPTDAGKSLQGLIDFMKEQVPEADWAVTPIWLKATAGLRMLEPAKSEAVLESVRDFLSNKDNSPFLFRRSWAKIIPGNEEGGFGWIAYNYLKKIIGPKRDAQSSESPYAVVEMGGASAQVSQVAPSTQEAEKIPPEYRFSFTIEKQTYNLYTYSYLGYGAEQAREQLNRLLVASDAAAPAVKDPCLNTGYQRPADQDPKEPYEGPKGKGAEGASTANPDQCPATLQNIFGSGTSSGGPGGNLRASVGSSTGPDGTASCTRDKPAPYTFDCVHQPSFVVESKNFLAFENFYYASSGLGVKPAAPAKNSSTDPVQNGFPLITTPQNMLDASKELCGADWTQAQQKYPLDAQPKDVALKLCFTGVYSYSFLVDGLKLPKDKLITVQKNVGDSEIEWALGAAYKEAAELLKRTNLRPT